jgi:MFS-type transporter involved in bile tolerance (Atg22 family)
MFKAALNTFGIAGMVVLIVALIVFMPFASIWAFNTLFPTFLIPYTFDTWVAAILLGMFFRGTGSVSTSKKD